MASQAAKGQEALNNSDYLEAIAQYTAALRTSKSPLWLINRSTAYQRLQKYELALADADNAVLAAIQRARRELIAAAQLRRGITLCAMKRYGDSRLCFAWCRKLDEKHKGIGIWQAKVSGDYETAEKEGNLEMLTCTVKETPDPVPEINTDSPKTKLDDKPVSESKATPVVAALQKTPKEKVRHEWYQSSSKVTITIFAKGVSKEEAEVNIEEGSLEVRFPTGDSGTYDYTVSPLFARIDPSSSEFRITPHKIEIHLHKSNPGQKWTGLEGSKDIAPAPSTPDKKATIPASVLSPAQDKSPSYPTSSRTGPKDWDSLASAALQDGNKNDGLGGDDGDDGDETDTFFKRLYKDASPDVRRAMMKSYQESNGTALSTDWDKVKQGPVEIKPPEGVEAKKWGE